MDDLINSFKAYLYDRVSSPLLSSFLVSWVLWNHRLFAVLLTSDFKILEKFYYVDEVLYPTFYEIGLRGFLWPLLSALFLLFVYPIPSRRVSEYVRNEQKKLKEVQQRIEDETPVTQEEARTLKGSLREAARILDEEISNRDQAIKSLQEEVSALTLELQRSRQPIAASPAPTEENGGLDPMAYANQVLTWIEQNVLGVIAEADGISQSDLKKKYKEEKGLTSLQVKYLLDQLSRKKLIHSYNADSADPYYVSTAAGRENLMNVQVTVGEQ